MLLLICCEALLQQRGKTVFRSISNQIALETETRPNYVVWVFCFHAFLHPRLFLSNQTLPGCRPAADFQVPLVYTSVYLRSADPGEKTIGPMCGIMSCTICPQSFVRLCSGSLPPFSSSIILWLNLVKVFSTPRVQVSPSWSQNKWDKGEVNLLSAGKTLLRQSHWFLSAGTCSKRSS